MMCGVQFEEVWKALYTGYFRSRFERMLRFRLDIDLDSVVGPGSMEDIVFDLLSQAEREGWTTDLMREAYRFNPRNTNLLKIYEKYGLAPRSSVQDSGAEVPQITAISSSGFEKTVKDRLPQL